MTITAQTTRIVGRVWLDWDMAFTLNLGRTVTSQGVLPRAELDIADGRVVAVRPGAAPDPRFERLWAVPGYVDTHCHGGAGFDFASPDAAGVQGAIDYHRRHGSTTLFASTVTEPLDVLADQVRRLRVLVEAGELSGIHLEGPFLAEAKKGAHNPELLRDPRPEYVAPLIEAGGGAVKMVTLAPERECGMSSIAQFIDGGVKVAFGHSDADVDQTRAAVDAGADIVTHLFNAMRPIHHREPGPVPELLHDDRVMVELICDGFHLHSEVVAMSIAAAGIERVGLVTDAMSATGQPDGDYILGTLRVQVRSGKARLLTEDGQPGAIAGSTLTMAKAVEFVVQQAGCSVPEAAQMAATTPARWHGLADVGSIEPGKWADLCFVTDEGALRGVLRRGEWVVEVINE